MDKNQIYQLARKFWYLYGSYLPKSVRTRILDFRRKRTLATIGAAGDQQDASGLAIDVLDSNIQAFLAKAKSNTKQNTKDGMGDYPSTRPQLAFDYISGLVRWLAESDYTLMSYNDLAEPVSYGRESSEFQHWIDNALERKEKAILLQYDVDARPDVTAALMKTHIEYGVPGNAMIFNKKIFDWKLKQKGIVEYDADYTLDFETFEDFQKSGGVIGYHCNAFDRAAGNMEHAIEIFHQDVTELRKHIDLKFFSMHGGHVTENGGCNARMDIAPYLDSLGMTWVHNGHSLYFHSNWADGSASNPRYRRESNDPLDFILSTNTGQRSRLLFHPQYYNDFSNSNFDFPILQDQKWVSDTRQQVQISPYDGEAYWKNRSEQARQNIAHIDKLFDPMNDERPVFINGMSRSGTTLLVSIFDAHPDGAMAYESYPRYLHIPADEGILTVEEYIYTYQTLMNYPDNIAFQLLNRSPLKNLMRFAAVTNWTGMTTQQVGELLRAYLTKHHRIPNALEALKIVAASARFKVRNQNAEFWGTKCQGNFEDYFSLWPKARLIYILRNGLDILASQKKTGSFNPDAKALGKSWRTQLERFVKFCGRNPKYTTALIQYENLVSDPDSAIQRLCGEIGIEFQPQMVRQHEAETTLSKNPRGQLSADRVQQPIDQKSVNKWKKILTKEDINQFLKGCGGTLLFERYGLEWEI